MIDPLYYSSSNQLSVILLQYPVFYYGNALNMILTLYGIPCKFVYDFSKLTILYRHVHNYIL